MGWQELPTFYLTKEDNLNFSGTFGAHFDSVGGFFAKVAPDLKEKLDRKGNFWEEIASGRISNNRLQTYIAGELLQHRYHPEVCRAAYLILRAREVGVLDSPEE